MNVIFEIIWSIIFGRKVYVFLLVGDYLSFILILYVFKNLEVLVIDLYIFWVNMFSLCEYGFRIVRYFIVVGCRWVWVIVMSLFMERSYIIVVILEGIIL